MKFRIYQPDQGETPENAKVVQAETLDQAIVSYSERTYFAEPFINLMLSITDEQRHRYSVAIEVDMRPVFITKVSRL